MKFDVHDLEGKRVGEIELDDDVFAAPVRPHLFHEVVTWQQAQRRRGTASTRTRATARGGGAKPYRQKGTGRARQGSRRSPLHVGGGKVFGPHPRDYSYRLPQKVRRGALRCALSLKAKEGRLRLVSDFTLPETKTREVVKVLAAFSTQRALLVDGPNEQLKRCARNLTNAKFLAHCGLNVEDILRYDHLFLSRSAAEAIAGALKP